MLRQFIRSGPAFIAGRCAPVSLLLLGLAVMAPQSRAQGNLGPITVGAGLQTSYTGTEPKVGDFNNTFALDHARIYISGPVYEGIKFMFNTDYDSVTNKIGGLDAVAQFGFAPHFNIWAGRFLPPSDRANLYGPFYSHEWNCLHRRHPGRISVRASRAATTASRIGVTFPKSEVFGRRLRRQVRDGKAPKSLAPRASRSISGIKKTATT